MESKSVNPLDRVLEQRAAHLLELLQSDIRAKVRAKDEYRQRERRHRASLLLASSDVRDDVWTTLEPLYQKVRIKDLPNTREFWRTVNIHALTRIQLDAICNLLDFKPTGRKKEIVARVEDWIYEDEHLHQQQIQKQQQLEQDHSLASTTRVFAVGNNSSGELAQGHRDNSLVVAQVLEIEQLRGYNVTGVYSGLDANFAFAIAADGTVLSWGGGNFSPNRLLLLAADATNAATKLKSTTAAGPTSRLVPQPIECLKPKKLKQIACATADGHVAVLSGDRQVYTWGNGESGQLGSGIITITSACESRPTTSLSHVDALEPHRITGISVGSAHSAAITSEGKLYTWGACWAGQLGLGDSKRIGETRKAYQRLFPSPTLVEGLNNVVITKVSCGALHTAVLSNTGQMYTFGCSDGGRLGLGLHVHDFSHPQLVTSLEPHLRVVDVACGNWHSLCLVNETSKSSPSRSISPGSSSSTISGWVYAFGCGLYGQLGLGKQTSTGFPTRVPTFVERNLQCQAIAVSSYHSCALTCDGRVFTWGRNASGCLGRPTAESDVFEPDEVLWEPPDEWGIDRVVSVAVGDRFTMFVTQPWQGEIRDTFQVQNTLNRRDKKSNALV